MKARIALFCWCLLAGATLINAAGAVEVYRLAPQDKVTVSVVRHEELTQTYTIAPDGTVEMIRIGTVGLSGKSTAEVAILVKEKLIASGLRDPEVTVLLAEARQRFASILGAVAKPGQYLIAAGARVMELLAAAGDLTADRNEVTGVLVRGKVSLPVNIPAALAEKDPAANLLLEEGDVLWVQAPDKLSVIVSGSVRTPGAYKVKPGCRFIDALAAAGDLALERQEIFAILTRGQTNTTIDLPKAYEQKETEANPLLKDGDLVLIQPHIKHTIVVSGSVKAPGTFRLAAGASLVNALAAAGDLAIPIDDANTVLYRGKTTLPIDLRKALDGKDPQANLLLQDGDVLWIQPRNRITIVVGGQVKTPGAYRLPEGCMPVDALAAAGDITERPERLTISLMRGKTTEKLEWGNITKQLEDGDVILVEREAISRIYINGHVKNPGAYELPANGGLLEAIALAGGMLGSPALDQITIIHANNNITERVNMAPMLVSGSAYTQNPHLEANDLVIIPESTATIAVLGSVMKPGNYAINPGKPLTVVDAIGLAGGQEKRGDLSKTMVIRVQNGKPQRLPVDVTAILKGGKADLNMPLQPRDIVVVPDNGKTDWDKLLENLYRVGILATVL